MKSLFMPGKNGLRIGRLFGIDVAVDFNWFLVFAFLVMFYAKSFERAFPSQMGSLAFGLVTTLALFASVLAHEYGHALTARLFGIRTQKIVLHLFGGVAYLESEVRRPREEFFVAIAGPAVSIVLAAVFGGLTLLTYGSTPTLAHLLGTVALVNFVLGVFNCVPGFPLDGGRVVRSIIWAATGKYLLATRIAAWGGMAVGGMIGLLGIAGPFFGGSIGGGVLQFLLGLFVIHLARLSVKQAQFIDAFRGVTVGDLLQPIRAVVPAAMPLSDVYDHYFREPLLDAFPVVEGPRLLGWIERGDLEAVPPRQWDWVRAHEIARPFEPENITHPATDALTALERLVRLERFSLPVFQGRRMLGIVTQADLGRVLAAHAAAHGGITSGDSGTRRPGTPFRTRRPRKEDTLEAPGS